MSTDKRSSHPSSKKPVFIGSEDHDRKPQLGTKQRSADHEDTSPVDTSTSQLLYARFRSMEEEGAERF